METFILKIVEILKPQFLKTGRYLQALIFRMTKTVKHRFFKTGRDRQAQIFKNKWRPSRLKFFIGARPSSLKFL